MDKMRSVTKDLMLTEEFDCFFDETDQLSGNISESDFEKLIDSNE
jgi:hypothetical protein